MCTVTVVQVSASRAATSRGSSSCHLRSTRQTSSRATKRCKYAFLLPWCVRRAQLYYRSSDLCPGERSGKRAKASMRALVCRQKRAQGEKGRYKKEMQARNLKGAQSSRNWKTRRRTGSLRAGSTRLAAAAAGLLALAVACTLIQLTEQLAFSSVQLPSLVQRNTNFWLVCQFELSRGEQLYSVKWYKDNEEFYRLHQAASDQTAGLSSEWQPERANQQLQQQYFAQAGVNVLMSSSNATHVRLLNGSLESEGVYACEISTQNLSTIRYEREIRVYVLPHSRLNIIGFKSRYAIGDRVDLTCSCDYSRPKPALTWFINGQRIQSSSRWFTLDSQTSARAASARPSEPSLFRLNLGLKFKLSAELLASLGSSGSKAASSLAFSDWTSGHHNQRNQSGRQQEPASQRRQLAANGRLNATGRPLRPQAATAAAAALGSTSGSLSPYQLELVELRLQCKYKLSEVSDVTYNELVVRQSPARSHRTRISSDLSAGEQLPSALASRLAPGGENEDRLLPERPDESSYKRLERRDGLNGRWIGDTGAVAAAWQSPSGQRRSQVRVAKSADNKVIQSLCPAPAHELWRSLWSTGGGHAHSSNCGPNTPTPLLLPEDPLLIEPDPKVRAEGEGENEDGESTMVEPSGSDGGELRNFGKNQQDYNDVDAELRAGEGGAIEGSPGEVISVNCSTIGALESIEIGASPDQLKAGEESSLEEPQAAAAAALDAGVQEASPNNLAPGGQARRSLTARREAAPKEGAHYQQAASHYCGDPSARRRSVISGKFQTNEELLRPGSSGRPALAYLSLSEASKWANSPEQRQQLTVVGGGGSAGQWRSAPASQANQAADSSDSSSAPSHATAPAELDTLLAPPLLEWFINNQEAPRASAPYEPELPLLAASGGASGVPQRGEESKPAEQGIQWQWRPLGGAPAPTTTHSGAESHLAQVLPSIDYAHYFANFERRPVHQHLLLNLTLEKRHFMTPDSKLRLRCSSTQAQVLAVDSASVTIIGEPASPPSGSPHGQWQQRPGGAHRSRLKYLQRGQVAHASTTAAANGHSHVNGASDNGISRVAFTSGLLLASMGLASFALPALI